MQASECCRARQLGTEHSTKYAIKDVVWVLPGTCGHAYLAKDAIDHACIIKHAQAIQPPYGLLPHHQEEDLFSAAPP